MLVSIIICVLNRESDIKKVINTLLAQDYENIEIIFIDNGSIDGTVAILNECVDSRITIIDGSNFKGSPYSARNLGIKHAKGDLIAFMDGYPTNSWVSNSIEVMKESNLDIVAGKVILPTNPTSTIYELYDSIFSLDIRYMVEKYSCAPTANLVVKKDVFNEVGLFDDNIRSGGDILFTSSATKRGFKLGFSEKSCSYYYTRDKSKLIDKQRRIAKGQVNIWRKRGRVKVEIFKTIIKFFVPFSPKSTYYRIVENSSDKIMISKIFCLYFLRYKLDRIRLYNTLLEVVRGSGQK
ncbi:putative glycosyltransferase EpsJ [Vibrio chagasii]|nr:putative glycosyltransferase EpsJ [Vibrio chagasii]CAH7392754.1 putative glycosyltransferase EpsJ [Vibrio chagasii]CAH7483130.1 putative glycosyltransferase EpsJ [Vibrio chagasii]